MNEHTTPLKMAGTLVTKPSLIEHGKLKFLIMDAPKDTNLHLYLKECKKHNVTDIVRISDPSYSVEEIERAGITLHVCSSEKPYQFVFNIF